MAGLYLHIPFCKRICAYCDFYKSANLRHLDAVVEAMCDELERERTYLHGEPIRTIYFGGGTPSLCSPTVLDRLLTACRRHFDCSSAEETTLEANPDDLTPGYLEELLRLGFDRLSIGIQSFNDDVLQLMNRRHTASEAIRCVKEAQAAGFKNITIDLIFGIPGFDKEVLEHSIDTALSLDVPHISAYHLTIEPHTLFGRRAARGVFQAVDEATSEREYLTVHQRLTAAGYQHYEVSNFAREGFRARHNSAYWQGIPYLGIGPAAHSYNGSSRRWNLPSIEGYLNRASTEGELLTRNDLVNEYIMTALRTVEGINLLTTEKRFGKEERDRLLTSASSWIERGTLLLTDNRLAIPPEHFLLSDAVIATLFTEEA